MKPRHSVLRAIVAALLFATVASGALLVLPSLVLIAVFVALPAGSALLLSGGHRDTFVANGMVTSLAAGATGAAWVGLGAEAERVVSVIVGAVLALVLLTLVAAFGCYVAGRLLKLEGGENR
ncbi:MAG: hypothetical protein ACKVT1_00270 [Dehalococcoidia bacterium]